MIAWAQHSAGILRDSAALDYMAELARRQGLFPGVDPLRDRATLELGSAPDDYDDALLD